MTAEAVPQVRGLSEAERKGKSEDDGEAALWGLGDEDGCGGLAMALAAGMVSWTWCAVWAATLATAKVIYGAHYKE